MKREREREREGEIEREGPHHPGGLSSHQAAVHCQGQITQGRERERESLRGKGGERE